MPRKSGRTLRQRTMKIEIHLKIQKNYILNCTPERYVKNCINLCKRTCYLYVKKLVKLPLRKKAACAVCSFKQYFTLYTPHSNHAPSSRSKIATQLRIVHQNPLTHTCVCRYSPIQDYVKRITCFGNVPLKYIHNFNYLSLDARVDLL